MVLGILVIFTELNVSVTPRDAIHNDGNAVVTSEEDAIAKVATDVSPSVVSITTKAS